MIKEYKTKVTLVEAIQVTEDNKKFIRDWSRNIECSITYDESKNILYFWDNDNRYVMYNGYYIIYNGLHLSFENEYDFHNKYENTNANT